MKKISEKQKKKNEEKKRLNQIMLSVFMDIWHKRRHYSEVSGRWLGKEPLTIFFHHILPKSRYPDAAFDEENIILLTGDEHTKVENDPTFYPEINDRREKLKQKHGKNNRSNKESARGTVLE